ncbi:MAG: hypothetical protein Aurels2KO_36760 [Aureliella sp.]
MIAIAIAVVCFVSVPRRSSVLLIVAAAVGLALSVGAFYRSVAPGHSVAAWFLLAGNCVATALAMIFALEMTGVLSPVELRDEQSARSMIKWLSIISFGALLATTLALSSVFFGQGPVSSIDAGRMRDEFQVIAWLFAATVMVVQFVVWFGLRRALRCGKIPREKAAGDVAAASASRKVAQEWGSLTISAWIALAAMIVTLAVPMNWPWKVDAPSDALVGELLD